MYSYRAMKNIGQQARLRENDLRFAIELNSREISFLVYVHRHCSYVRIRQEMGGLASMPLNAVRQGLGRKGVDNALSKYLL